LGHGYNIAMYLNPSHNEWSLCTTLRPQNKFPWTNPFPSSCYAFPFQ
jgi:hypothetical protein